MVYNFNRVNVSLPIPQMEEKMEKININRIWN